MIKEDLTPQDWFDSAERETRTRTRRAPRTHGHGELCAHTDTESSAHTRPYCSLTDSQCCNTQSAADDEKISASSEEDGAEEVITGKERSR